MRRWRRPAVGAGQAFLSTRSIEAIALPPGRRRPESHFASSLLHLPRQHQRLGPQRTDSSDVPVRWARPAARSSWMRRSSSLSWPGGGAFASGALAPFISTGEPRKSPQATAQITWPGTAGRWDPWGSMTPNFANSLNQCAILCLWRAVSSGATFAGFSRWLFVIERGSPLDRLGLAALQPTTAGNRRHHRRVRS